MTNDPFRSTFSPEVMSQLFPSDLSDRFFEALYGDAEDGAYDISLAYAGRTDQNLLFELQLNQRPDKCLVCSLTYGLPEVFSRHPLINIKGIVAEIEKRIAPDYTVDSWSLTRTREVSRSLHIVPLEITIKKA